MKGRLLRTAALGGAALMLAACGRKEAPSPAAPEEPAAATPTVSGAEIYDLYCAVCHMADGHGVPNFQPGLHGSPIVVGDPAKLEAVIRAGSAALTDRPSEFGAGMPPFGNLDDDEVKAIVAYVRERFGPAAP